MEQDLKDIEQFIVFYDKRFSDCFKVRDRMQFTYDDLKESFLAGRNSASQPSNIAGFGDAERASV